MGRRGFCNLQLNDKILQKVIDKENNNKHRQLKVEKSENKKSKPLKPSNFPHKLYV